LLAKHESLALEQRQHRGVGEEGRLSVDPVDVLIPGDDPEIQLRNIEDRLFGACPGENRVGIVEL
jgi:hypothetical protein